MLLKIFQPAEIVKAAMRKVLGKANGYIDIVGIGLPAGGGAEQGNAHHAGGTEFLFVHLQCPDHLVAVHGFILPIPSCPVKALLNSRSQSYIGKT